MKYSLGIVLVAAALATAGCGGSGTAVPTTAATTTATAKPATPPPAATTTPAPAGPGALQAEATAAATGDIPDNQIFLTFHNGASGYSMKYPEGWAQQGTGNNVVFRDKNNIGRIELSQGAAPTVATVKADIARLAGVKVEKTPHALTVSGQPAIAVTYSTRSAPNPVTGKRVELVVDRYYLWHGNRRAVIELATARGVDNVDAYRMMIGSFKWS